MVKIKVNPEYPGPTLLELEASLSDILDPVEVKWQGSKLEYLALEANSERRFILIVPDLPAMERTATLLGKACVFDNALLTAALSSLTSRKAYGWRSFSEGVGSTVTRGIITRLSAGAIRKGVSPRLADIASEIILEGVNPIDSDILLRLRVLRGN